MSGSIATLAGRAADLRRAFDASFTVPAAADLEASTDLIVIRIGDSGYAIKLAEIAGVHVDVSVTPVPSPVAAFRGLAAYRSALTPVYDLAALLGGTAALSPRWTVLAASLRVALTFDAFEHHVAVAPSAISPAETVTDASHVHAIVHSPFMALPIIDLASVASTIRRQMPKTFPEEK